MFNSFKKLIGASALALIATFGMSHTAHAQKGGHGVLNSEEVQWPTSLTVDVGAMANDNWQGSGSYSIDGSAGYTQSPGLPNPEFHAGLEIPVARNMMFMPRVAYNDYSVRWDHPSGSEGEPLAVSYRVLGADLLMKYSLNNFHIMAGGNVSTPLNASYAHSFHMTDATHSTTDIPSASSVIASIKGGLGYDIPVNPGNTIFITPEAFYTYPVTNFSQTNNGDELFVATLSGGASLKFVIQ